MRVFLRDRFTDRYSGARLVFPGTLRLLSKLMPDELPAVASGEVDDESNWVTTSMVRNSAKSNWTLEDLGWTLQPCDAQDAWDGLGGFCRAYLAAHPEHLADKYIARWHRALTVALETTT